MNADYRNLAIDALATLCKIEPSLIEAALLCLNRGGYRKFSRPKKNGGKRWFYAPAMELKIVQDAILDFLYRWPVHPRMFGFEPGGGQIRNAASHIDANGYIPKWLVRLDIKDAFPSVKTEKVIEMFVEMLQQDEYVKLGYLGDS